MTWKYPRSIENDFGNVMPVQQQLHKQIQAGSSTWSQPFKGVQLPQNGEDTVNVCFDAEPTAAEILVVNTICAAYVYVDPGVEPINNSVALNDPTASNDSTVAGGGFAVGSLWFNKILKRRWECSDATPTLALWKLTNVRTQNIVVDSEGGGDYKSISAATADGHNSIFVKNGLYFEFADIVLNGHGAQIIGETMGGVTVVFMGAFTLRCDATNGNEYKVGAVSCAHLGNTVTGVGTMWTANVMPGHMMMLSENYYTIASVESDTSLTLADTYNGNTLNDFEYVVQPMFLGVRINNMIMANSSSTGLFLRGLRNSTVYGVAVKGCSPNIHVQHCGNIGIVNGASEKSTGDGIIIDECVSVRIDTMAFSNCTQCGVSVVNRSSAVVIGGSSSNSNKVHGVHIQSGSRFINVNDTVVRSNNMKGICGELDTRSIVIVNCDTCDNGDVGIDILGPNNSISDSPVMGNGGAGINVGDLSIISDNHVSQNGGDGLNLVTSNDCVVVSNTIDGNEGDGIDISGGGNVVGMNRIQNNKGWGIKVQTGAHNTVAFNYSCTSNTLGTTSDLGTRTRHSSCVTHNAVDPTAADDVIQHVSLGDMWVNSVSKRWFMCLDTSAGAAKWSGGVAAPTASLSANSTNAAGVALTNSASDHSHAIDFAAGKTGGLLLCGGAGTVENLQLQANAADTATGYILAHSRVCTQSTPSGVKTVATTLTAVEVLGGCIPVNPSAATFYAALPTAAELVSEMGVGAAVGDSLQFSVVHDAASSFPVTLAMAAGCTSFGSLSVPNSGSMAACFLIRLTNVTATSEACTVFRIS